MICSRRRFFSRRLSGPSGRAAIASASRGDRLSLELPPHQLEFLRGLREGNDKPIVTVITGGSPFILGEVSQLADAVLFAWYPGQEGGVALADILFGRVSPSGRLPVTFPVSEDQLPPYEDYAMAGRTYRYLQEPPMYPFGFGLSYGTVELSKLEVAGADTLKRNGEGAISVSVDARAGGSMAFEEVVQLYLSPPATLGDQPRHSLKGFQRVSLNPGSTARVHFDIPAEAFMTWDESGEKALRPGSYEVTVSNAVPTRRSAELGAASPVKTIIEID